MPARETSLNSRVAAPDENQAHLIIEKMQLGLLVYQLEDRTDDRTLRLTAINPAACRLLGFSPRTVVGHYIDEIFPLLREAGVPQLLANVITANKADRKQKLRYEDGQMDPSFWSFQAVPLPDDCVAVTFEDISRQIDIETDAKRRVRQLEALRAIDLAILGSHDVRLTMQVFLDQLTNQLHTDAAGTLLFQEHTEMLEVTACRGFRQPEIYGPLLGMDEGLPGRVTRSHDVVEIPDLSAEPGFLRAAHFRGEGFVAYCGVPLVAKGKLRGVLEVFHRSPLNVSPDWRNFLRTLAAQAAIAVDNAVLLQGLQQGNRELAEAYEQTLEGWARALELRDWETEGHTRRVTDMSVALARQMGIKGDALAYVRRGALLHDVGKIGIPDEILRKPGPLSADEWVVMRRHPEYGYELLKPIAFLHNALDIPRYHHERWDGGGYPHGLREETIPLAARVFSVVDAWDAMMSDRPYRKGLPVEKVRAEIRKGAGSQFDPQVVDVFLQSDLCREFRTTTALGNLVKGLA